MALEEYKEKRDFGKTPEPKPEGKKTGKQRFVIQEHNASHLHYDFRLELPEKMDSGDIVLKSWAIPKNLPDKSGIKRLAIQTEDHPVDYIDFSGIIPSGYGAGTVKIWDKGTFKLTGSEEKSLKFILHGEKLSGEYHLFWLHKKEREENQWMIVRTSK